MPLVKRKVGVYAEHPWLPEPPLPLVGQLPKSAQRMCIAGTVDQMECSEEKEATANYDDTTWKFFVSVRGTIVHSCWKHILLVSLLSLGLTISHKAADEWITIDDAGHVLTILPVGFLLVFRLNLSYNRWWDGRESIASMVYAARKVAVKTLTHVSNDSPHAAIMAHARKVYRLAMAMVVCTRHSVQTQVSGEHLISADKKALLGQLRMWELEHYLTTAQMGDLRLAQPSMWPVVVTNMLMEQVVAPCRNRPEDAEHEVVYQWPNAAADITEAAEQLLQSWQAIVKIASTPMPFPYAHSLDIFLLLWVYTFPFSLLGSNIDLGWLTPIVAVCTCVLLMGINAVAQVIEDPFGNDPADFDLVRFQEQLHRELNDLLEQPDPKKPVPNRGEAHNQPIWQTETDIPRWRRKAEMGF
eukprot:TRINITY_DN47658_c0_g1_i1.p1 TRINITY_DN47658_c0_g1~~TRINITY_DN47658_c0_g1_i1.p1  ORF type:complete len:438 (+),score=110.13 TRINITY_DN47658_c0_g1_i1:78-1316(+)